MSGGSGSATILGSKVCWKFKRNTVQCPFLFSETMTNLSIFDRRQIVGLQFIVSLIHHLKEMFKNLSDSQAKQYLKENPIYFNKFKTLKEACLGALLIILGKVGKKKCKVTARTRDLAKETKKLVRDIYCHPGQDSDYWTDDNANNFFQTVRALADSLPGGTKLKDELHRKEQIIHSAFYRDDDDKMAQILQGITKVIKDIKEENNSVVTNKLQLLTRKFEEARQERQLLATKVEDAGQERQLLATKVEDAGQERQRIDSKIIGVENFLEKMGFYLFVIFTGSALILSLINYSVPTCACLSLFYLCGLYFTSWLLKAGFLF